MYEVYDFIFCQCSSVFLSKQFLSSHVGPSSFILYESEVQQSFPFFLLFTLPHTSHALPMPSEMVEVLHSFETSLSKCSSFSGDQGNSNDLPNSATV